MQRWMLLSKLLWRAMEGGGQRSFQSRPQGRPVQQQTYQQALLHFVMRPSSKMPVLLPQLAQAPFRDPAGKLGSAPFAWLLQCRQPRQPPLRLHYSIVQGRRCKPNWHQQLQPPVLLPYPERPAFGGLHKNSLQPPFMENKTEIPPNRTNHMTVASHMPPALSAKNTLSSNFVLG